LRKNKDKKHKDSLAKVGNKVQQLKCNENKNMEQERGWVPLTHLKPLKENPKLKI
jgi:hypothetical protein